MKLFDLLGILLALYTLLSIARGHVFGKSGVWGHSYSREDEPHTYWLLIVVYAGLSVVLIAWF